MADRIGYAGFVQIESDKSLIKEVECQMYQITKRTHLSK